MHVRKYRFCSFTFRIMKFYLFSSAHIILECDNTMNEKLRKNVEVNVSDFVSKYYLKCTLIDRGKSRTFQDSRFQVRQLNPNLYSTSVYIFKFTLIPIRYTVKLRYYVGVRGQNEDPSYRQPAVLREISREVIVLNAIFLFITNWISNYNKNYIFTFKRMPYLIGVFIIVRYFLSAWQLLAFLGPVRLNVLQM
jgi:hypothetical protein